MMDFLIENKEWILSGIVAIVVSIIANILSVFLKNRISKKKKYMVKNIEKSKKTINDTYILEFISIDEQKNIGNSELKMVKMFTENILNNIPKLSLIGREFSINIGSSRLLIDLVLYDKGLNSYIIFEFKKSIYRHEHRMQLQQYLEYFDKLLKKDNDENSIGFLINYSEDNIETKAVLNEKTKDQLDFIENIEKLRIQLLDIFNKQLNANTQS